ncbi:MAG: phosphatase PAP2 family protein [Acidobacteriota bacterium]
MEQYIKQAGRASRGTLVRAEQARERYARYVLPILIGYVLLATASSVALAISARQMPYFKVDLTISRALQAIRLNWFDRLMGFVCGLGYPLQSNILGALLLGFLYRLGFQWEALTAVVATVGSLVIALGLILFANRPRPSPDLVRVQHKMWTTSFPSGHTLIFTSVIGFLCFLILKAKLPALVRAPLLLVFGSIIVLMGPARVYSGEHWASDVVAGYLLGSTWLAIIIKIYKWGRPHYMASHPKTGKTKWLE